MNGDEQGGVITLTTDDESDLDSSLPPPSTTLLPTSTTSKHQSTSTGNQSHSASTSKGINGNGSGQAKNMNGTTKMGSSGTMNNPSSLSKGKAKAIDQSMIYVESSDEDDSDDDILIGNEPVPRRSSKAQMGSRPIPRNRTVPPPPPPRPIPSTSTAKKKNQNDNDEIYLSSDSETSSSSSSHPQPYVTQASRFNHFPPPPSSQDLLARAKALTQSSNNLSNKTTSTSSLSKLSNVNSNDTTPKRTATTTIGSNDETPRAGPSRIRKSPVPLPRNDDSTPKQSTTSTTTSNSLVEASQRLSISTQAHQQPIRSTTTQPSLLSRISPRKPSSSSPRRSASSSSSSNSEQEEDKESSEEEMENLNVTESEEDPDLIVIEHKPIKGNRQWNGMSPQKKKELSKNEKVVTGDRKSKGNSIEKEKESGKEKEKLSSQGSSSTKTTSSDREVEKRLEGEVVRSGSTTRPEKEVGMQGIEDGQGGRVGVEKKVDKGKGKAIDQDDPSAENRRPELSNNSNSTPKATKNDSPRKPGSFRPASQNTKQFKSVSPSRSSTLPKSPIRRNAVDSMCSRNDTSNSNVMVLDTSSPIPESTSNGPDAGIDRQPVASASRPAQQQRPHSSSSSTSTMTSKPSESPRTPGSFRPASQGATHFKSPLQLQAVALAKSPLQPAVESTSRSVATKSDVVVLQTSSTSLKPNVSASNRPNRNATASTPRLHQQPSTTPRATTSSKPTSNLSNPETPAVPLQSNRASVQPLGDVDEPIYLSSDHDSSNPSDSSDSEIEIVSETQPPPRPTSNTNDDSARRNRLQREIEEERNALMRRKGEFEKARKEEEEERRRAAVEKEKEEEEKRRRARVEEGEARKEADEEEYARRLREKEAERVAAEEAREEARAEEELESRKRKRSEDDDQRAKETEARDEDRWLDEFKAAEIAFEQEKGQKENQRRSATEVNETRTGEKGQSAKEIVTEGEGKSRRDADDSKGQKSSRDKIGRFTSRSDPSSSHRVETVTYDSSSSRPVSPELQGPLQIEPSPLPTPRPTSSDTRPTTMQNGFADDDDESDMDEGLPPATGFARSDSEEEAAVGHRHNRHDLADDGESGLDGGDGNMSTSTTKGFVSDSEAGNQDEAYPTHRQPILSPEVSLAPLPEIASLNRHRAPEAGSSLTPEAELETQLGFADDSSDDDDNSPAPPRVLQRQTARKSGAATNHLRARKGTRPVGRPPKSLDQVKKPLPSPRPRASLPTRPRAASSPDPLSLQGPSISFDHNLNQKKRPADNDDAETSDRRRQLRLRGEGGIVERDYSLGKKHKKKRLTASKGTRKGGKLSTSRVGSSDDEVAQQPIALMGSATADHETDEGKKQDMIDHERRFKLSQQMLHPTQRQIAGPSYDRSDEFPQELQTHVYRAEQAWQKKHFDGSLPLRDGYRFLYEQMVYDSLSQEFSPETRPSIRICPLEGSAPTDWSSPPFEICYTNRVIYDDGIVPDQAPGCKCVGNCGDPRNRAGCACRKRQAAASRTRLGGGFRSGHEDFAYDEQGLLNENVFIANDPIIECNSQCGCGPECINRVVGSRKSISVDLFHTGNKGWAVRNPESYENEPLLGNYQGRTIKRGEMLGVYAGELLLSTIADERDNVVYSTIGRCYTYALDSWTIGEDYKARAPPEDADKMIPTARDGTHKSGAQSAVIPNEPIGSSTSSKRKKKGKRKQKEEIARKVEDVAPPVMDEDGYISVYSIDAFSYGNWTRFANHVCNGFNVIPRAVYVDDDNVTRPLWVYVARRDILPGEEITISYFSQSDPNPAEHGLSHRDWRRAANRVRREAAEGHRCYCGEALCRGVMFNLSEGDGEPPYFWNIHIN